MTQEEIQNAVDEKELEIQEAQDNLEQLENELEDIWQTVPSDEM